MTRRRLWQVALVALVALLGGVSPLSVAAQFPSQEGGEAPLPSARGGGFYESQTYGFSLSWGAEWTLQSEEQGEGYEIISLGNGVSQVILGVVSDPATPQDVVLNIANSAGGGQWEFLEAIYDEPNRAGAYFLAPQDESGHFIDVVGFGHPAKLLTIWDFPGNQFEAELEAFLALMEGFTPGARASGRG